MKITTLSFVFLLAVLFFVACPTKVVSKVPSYCKYVKFLSCSTYIAKWNTTCKCLKRGACGNCIQNDCGCDLTKKGKVSQSDFEVTKRMVKEIIRFMKQAKNKRLSDSSWVKFKKPKCFMSITRTYCPKGCECIKRDSCDRCQETVCGKCSYVY
ncbi:hypothetical protein ABK040_011719 [Willaertia magna]